MEDLQTSKSHSWKSWLLPLGAGCGMGLGALIGISGFSDTLSHEGPAGDAAGAAGALIVGVCLLVGFGMTMLTVIVAKIMGRQPVQNITSRLALSLLGGGVVGALGVTGAETSSWFILVFLPVLLAWPRH
jgi:Na+/H+ antiporter NhaA